MKETEKYLLDTHIWLWLLEGDAKLQDSKNLDLWSKNSELRVSAISFWEVGVLEAKARLRFHKPFRDWVEAASNAPGILVEPLDIQILIESSRLPGKLHGDPADRIIVATARKTGAILLTRDQPLLDYAKAGHVRALRA